MENKYDKMIDRFLLTDNCDESYSDLIIFKEPININEVYKAVNKVTTELEGTYTNEDILSGLEVLNVEFEIIDLYNTERIYY
mgnify:CR=1 FL=1